MSEYPIGYEYVPGEKIALAWKGERIPVPPKWVQDRSDVPQRMKLACLSAELQDAFPKRVRNVLVEYVKQWPAINESGTDLIITGRVPNHRRLWAGSAVLNEIMMRYSNVMGVSVAWLANRGLHWMMDAKAKHMESYSAMRNRLLNSNLLLVEDLLLLPPSSDHWWFMNALYQHRFDNKLPTITTLNTTIDKGDWSKLKPFVGPVITEILSTNHEQFHAQFESTSDA